MNLIFFPPTTSVSFNYFLCIVYKCRLNLSLPLILSLPLSHQPVINLSSNLSLSLSLSHQPVTSTISVTTTDIPSSTCVYQPCTKYMYHIMYQSCTKTYTIPCTKAYHTMHQHLYHVMHQTCTTTSNHVSQACANIHKPCTKRCTSNMCHITHDILQSCHTPCTIRYHQLCSSTKYHKMFLKHVITSPLLHLQQQKNNIFINIYLSLMGLVFGLVKNPNFKQA
jgi:hypothetical protein